MAWRSSVRSRSPAWSRTAGRARRSRRSRTGRTAGPRRIPVARASSGTIATMTVPGRVEAASLLLSLDPPPWLVRHARAVAEVAAWLAARIVARGVLVDRRLVESAALLHDLDKALPADDPARDLRHGDGLGGLADPGRSPGAGPRGRGTSGDPSARRRHATGAGRHSHRARSGSWPMPTSAPGSASSRWTRGSAHGGADIRPPGPTRTCERSGPAPTDLEADVCRAAGVTPADVARLAWTGAALRAAREARR